MKNYALVKKTDFTDSGTQMPMEKPVPEEQEPAEKSAAINEVDAKSDAESSSTDSHEFASNQIKNALPQICLEGQCVLVDDIGLESTAETRELCTFAPKATPNPTPSFEDDKLAQIVAQWPLLSGDLKAKIFECVVAESRLADSLRSA